MSVNRGIHRNVLLLLSFLLLCCVVAHSESQVEGGGGTIGYNSQEMLMIISNDSEFIAITSEKLLMPNWAYKSAAGYLLFISVTGLILNTIVVLVLINDKQKMTPLNWMLLNLACSDGISAGFGAPISIEAAFNSGWPFSKELCAAYAMIISTAGIGSITTLSVLAMIRCKLVVQNPVSNRLTAFTAHSVRLGWNKAAILLALIWSYVLIVTSPPMFGWGNYDREAAHISCSVNWELKTGSNQSYIFYMFTFGLIVPMIVIFVSYFNILRAVRKVKREINKRRSISGNSTNLHSSNHFSRRRRRLLLKKQLSFQSDAAEKRSTIMVAVMIGAFLIAWTPYSILALVETFSDNNVTSSVVSISPVLATVPSLFAKTSSVLNPIIYGFLNTQFKLAWETMTLRFLNRFGHRQHLMVLDKEQSRPRPFLSSFDTALTITHITVKPSVIYHLPMTKDIADEYQTDVRLVQQSSPSNQLAITAQVDDDKWHQQLIIPSGSAEEVKTSIKSIGEMNKEEEMQQQEQPVLLVVVRYVSSSLVHRRETHEMHQLNL